METNPSEQWQQLTQLYREKFDGELEDLARNSDDLTETAREVLRNEMKNRGLAMPGETSGAATSAESARARFVSSVDQDGETVESHLPMSGEGGDQEFSWKVLLCECDTSAEAWQISQVLKRAGIDNWIEGVNSRWGGYPKVLVAADQLEEATRIANQPIPADIIEDSNQEIPEYETPTCPKCRAEDPVLESAEPNNSWLCEACGAQWTDPEPKIDQHQG